MSIDVMASLKDIAETAGCSVSTVSRVLKNKGEIAPATRKKILAIADQFGYHDNRLIYGIRTGRTQTIGLVCDFGNPFFQRIAHGIELELKKEDYLVIFSSNEENDQKTLKRLVEQRVDGVILVPRNDFADTEYFRDVISRGLPIITIDRKTPANVDYVGSDDLYCGRIMVHPLRVRHSCVYRDFQSSAGNIRIFRSHSLKPGKPLKPVRRKKRC